MISLHACLLLGAASAGAWALFGGAEPPRWAGLAGAPFAWFVVGSRMRALANIVHECVHGSFFRSQGANAFLGRSLALLDLHSFDAYAREHLSHHARLGVPGEDLDFEARRPFRFHRPETRPGARFLARALLLSHVPRYVRPRLRVAGEPAGWAAARLAWIAAIAACAFLAPGPFLAFVALPWLTTYQLFRYWSDALDHAGCLHEDEEFLRSRNHLLRPRALEWLALPRNDAYHLVHHLFPSLPARHFPAVHRDVLLSQADYAAREHAWRPFP